MEEVSPLKGTPEPDLRGDRPLSVGLSKDWLEWYRINHDCGLRDALEEGKRRLEARYRAAVKGQDPDKDPKEPEVLSNLSRFNPSPAWITWYREKHKVSLAETLLVGRAKVKKRLAGNA